MKAIAKFENPLFKFVAILLFVFIAKSELNAQIPIVGGWLLHNDHLEKWSGEVVIGKLIKGDTRYKITDTVKYFGWPDGFERNNDLYRQTRNRPNLKKFKGPDFEGFCWGGGSGAKPSYGAQFVKYSQDECVVLRIVTSGDIDDYFLLHAYKSPNIGWQLFISLVMDSGVLENPTLKRTFNSQIGKIKNMK